ncbi:MAG: SUMF1/EgtB/PvdO family nonheme iron enzyme [Synechococcales cyanobacterium K44_A2020_017]|nr:SUMF1/EgtB/PvdO family nonheme iron enzyme [Synechococcales cyanobacterium K32_A2020_035]MBF2095097.1 SUMF1/EgtB/PvdO family nonheme iron enzyme [Synechococcales cyanobacterium K44_A2020_017]
MLHCLNPDCQAENPPGTKFCQKCGTPFLLKQRYQCDRTLGQGGFGRTHLVRDGQRGNAKVVVKQFIPSEELRKSTGGLQKALQLFHEESERLLQLDQHPQIPILFEAFEEHKSHFLVQQFIDGQTLADELDEQGTPFTEAQVRSLLLDLLPVLQFVHDRQIIHRDIKPENIIRRQIDNRLVLIDFGAAKVVTQTALAKTGTMIGSAGYAAPEQSYGKAIFASDLYSLGVTCLNLLTQMHPFKLYDNMNGTFAWQDFLRNSPVNDKLGTVLDKLIHSSPKYRYGSAQDVLRDLEQIPPFFATPTASWSKNYTERLQTGSLHQQEVLLDMVYIPAGQFMMGAPNDEPEARDNEKPQRCLTVPALWMGKFPITQAQYQAIMGSNPSHFKGDNRPVEQVSWYDAVKFCQQLSAKTGKRYRLPSEAEWEYACRAGSTTPFYFGQILTDNLANYKATETYNNSPVGICREETVDVRSFPANGFGLYDMHGNVWEWCLDYWHESYDGAPSDCSAWTTSGVDYDVMHEDVYHRIARGGSWRSLPKDCRSAVRFKIWSGNQSISIGFRVIVAEA